MKLQSTLSAVLFATVATLSFGTHAADTDKATPAAEMKAEQGVKPHSHAQEKTGVPQKAPDAVAPEKKHAAKDKTKHFHPRDAK